MFYNENNSKQSPNLGTFEAGRIKDFIDTQRTKKVTKEWDQYQKKDHLNDVRGTMLNHYDQADQGGLTSQLHRHAGYAFENYLQLATTPGVPGPLVQHTYNLARTLSDYANGLSN